MRAGVSQAPSVNQPILANMETVLEFFKATFPLMLTMIFCGSIGGLAAYLTSSRPVSSTIRFGAAGYCIVGAITALTVPLFLSLLQSKILDGVQKTSDGEAYLIFGSFCIVAGFSAKSFLTTLSDRVMNELTNKMQDNQQRAQVQIQELKDNLTYANQKSEAPPAQPSPKLSQVGKTLSKLETEVLKAAGLFAVRSIEAIAQDCGLSKTTTEESVAGLIERDLAARVHSTSSKNPLVTLTEDGLSLAAKLATGAIL